MTDPTSFALKGKAKQWCHLGCNALEENDYKKAVILLNMSLHLSDVNTEPAIKTQTYHALAEAYFNINEHEKALDAGKNCFKLQSVKSEVQFEPFYNAKGSRQFKKQRRQEQQHNS